MYRLCVQNLPSELLQTGRKLEKLQWHHNFATWRPRQVFFDTVLFLLSRLVIRPSFMLISSLDLELWRFSFRMDWPEIWKLEIPPSKFYPISGYWDEQRIPNLARMYLIKCYWMLQNPRVTVFTVFELLREVKVPPNQIRVKGTTYFNGTDVKAHF